MNCILNGRDSIVVLPTGGGKSLCFQAPALLLDGMAVVVSPLISLMKDQVDALQANGVPAASLNSAMTSVERQAVDRLVRIGQIKLLYVSPERLVSDDFIRYLNQVKLSFIAVDEAHCVSIWGHDFRPEYRMLGILKERFSGITVHAYTATATGQVQQDIARDIKLDVPEILVGSYDRPNLIYSVKRADNRFNQILSVIDRHRHESGIIYCIRRVDVDKLSHRLRTAGYDALPYHAGMDPEDRRRNQEAFIQERTDIIVATVAFGMGIDKSNVRYVIHSGMPKSIEHYQQESGRAGRDGLAAECLLIYTAGDFGVWMSILDDLEGDAKEAARLKLFAMSDYCTGIECRHKALVNYFGQEYQKSGCDACDVCLNDLKLTEDALVIGQKILSCVKRLDEKFGAGYIGRVLVGSQEQRILEWKHERLSTYGLLSEYARRQVRDWIEQLIAQGYILKTGEFNTLKVSDSGWMVLRGKEIPKLLNASEVRRRERRISMVEAESWDGVDRDLFERLRSLRRDIAVQKNVPAFIVFGDTALRDMARLKPTTQEEFLTVYGVGKQKAKEYAGIFTNAILEWSNSIGIKN